MNLSGDVAVKFVAPPRETRVATGEGSIVAVMRFVRWMESRKTPANFQHVVDHFGVHRSTAYRWLRGYDRAKGLDHAR